MFSNIDVLIILNNNYKVKKIKVWNLNDDFITRII